MITYLGGIVTAGRRGVMFQHQVVWRRNDRPVCVPEISGWDCLPRSQARNVLSWCLRVMSSRVRMLDAPQVGHFQRCVPAAVFPFLTSLVWHSRHWVVLVVLGTVKGAGV